MVVKSDPVVQFFEPGLECYLCQGEGHTHRSCPQASRVVGPDMSFEDWVFWSYVAPCDRPEGYDT